MIRATMEEIGLAVAFDWSRRGTCPRRQIGCLLVDERTNTLATGYNGPASGEPHCIDHPCAGANLPSGTGLSQCEAIHAEINALMRCSDVFRIHTAYCTDSPCDDCVKALLGTSCKRIVFGRHYPHKDAERRWRQAGREWVHVTVSA